MLLDILVGEAWFIQGDNFAATGIGNIAMIVTITYYHEKPLIPNESEICIRSH